MLRQVLDRWPWPDTPPHAGGVEVALDGQLSNWSFGAAGDVDGGEPGEPDSGPVLIDVGTPFMRRGAGTTRSGVPARAGARGHPRVLPPAR